MSTNNSIIFNKEAALDLLGGDSELLQILIDSFLEENKFELSVLEKLISDGKMDEAASYVHATKGAARQLCMEQLKTSGQELEDVLRNKKSGDIAALTKKMFDDYAQSLKILKEN